MKVEIRELTLGGLDVLQQMDCGVFRGDESVKSIMEYTYVCSTPIKEVLKATKGDNWDDAITIFSDQFSMDDIQEIAEVIGKQNQKITSATVEPVEQDSAKKKD